MPAPPVSYEDAGAGQPSTRAVMNALRGQDRVSVGDRRSMVRVTYVAHVEGQPLRRRRVAFAVGRHVGTAVVRNRCRRRVRAAFDDIAQTQKVPDGAYLFRPRGDVAEVGYTELVEAVRDVIDAVTTRSGS